MPHKATGTFEVALKPLEQDDTAGAASLGRMSLDKQFSGDLVGIGKGTMLTAMTPTQGSAGYVAIERVTGTLGGRSGSFVLQHTGSMDRGAKSLTISVVPDSGTEQLTGLTGQLAINIVEGKHFYDFGYSLPD